VLARGELTAKLDVHAHAVSKPPSGDHRAGGTVTLVPPFKARTRPVARRQGQPVRQPLTPTGGPSPPHRRSAKDPPVLSNLKNVFKIPDLRNKILFTCDVVVYRLGVAIRVPASTTWPSTRSVRRQHARARSGS
jgi:hypothetical protein